jgi:chitin synthase
METKGWDVFRVIPPEQDSSSEAMNKRCMAITVRVLKVIAYIVCFAVVLGGAVISKGTVLFMTSQIRPRRQVSVCSH